MLIYQRFALKLANMLSSSLIPDANKIVFSQIFDNIAALDVDIKIRLRKGTHLEKFNNLGGSSQSASASDKKAMLQTIMLRIESKEIYNLKLMTRNQDEREIKVELMLTSLLAAIDDQIKLMNKGGKRAINKFANRQGIAHLAVEFRTVHSTLHRVEGEAIVRCDQGAEGAMRQRELLRDIVHYLLHFGAHQPVFPGEVTEFE
jgi:hypothetical protein